jgi:hypothetical protein
VQVNFIYEFHFRIIKGPYKIHYEKGTSDIKKNEIMSFVGKWMEMKINMLSKIAQFSLTCET